ncbi:MAG TPA: hypothetical protein VLL25_05950, partial [Acidimicrobiales bacterium]|nr:hypothetical protein [Acidimicrobiales bacterium]
TLDDVMRRLDAIDRDLLSAFRQFELMDTRFSLIFDRFDAVDTRLETVMEAVVGIGRDIRDHRHDGGGRAVFGGDDG